MILDRVSGGPRYLSYCTNVHPGESPEEIQRDLTTFAVPLRERLAPGRPFALGLRLGERAVRDLQDDPATFEAFAQFLDRHDFVAYTMNVFPQGAFHDDVVKRKVYEPGWADPARAAYTLSAARVLARLLPDGDDLGTLSTLPLAWEKDDDGLRDRATAAVARTARDLALLEADTGRRILLCIEPEPLCLVETTGEAVAWYRDHLLLRSDDLEPVAGRSGEEILRRHVGVCYDACHHAVEFEDAAYGMERLRREGIEIGKIQLSCALEVPRPRENPDGLARLLGFDEPRFLHQVVARDDRFGLHRFEDLPEFARWLEEARVPVDVARCHFHVPIHLASAFPLLTTRPVLQEVMHREAVTGDVRHLEVETYTFGVLPAETGAPTHLEESLAAEIAFAADGLRAQDG